MPDPVDIALIFPELLGTYGDGGQVPTFEVSDSYCYQVTPAAGRSVDSGASRDCDEVHDSQANCCRRAAPWANTTLGDRLCVSKYTASASNPVTGSHTSRARQAHRRRDADQHRPAQHTAAGAACSRQAGDRRAQRLGRRLRPRSRARR